MNLSALNMMVPAYANDKIIGSFTDTVAISAPTAGGGYTTVTTSYAHGFSDSAYFQGIFSSDGGISWNDFGAQIPNLTTPTQPVFQTLDCNATVDTTNLNVTITNYYDYVNSVGTSYTVTYKVYLLAKNSMTYPITPLSINNPIQYASKYNYQKIVDQGTVNLTVASGATGSAVVTHNLNVIPDVRAFWFNSGSSTCYPISYSAGNVSGSGTDSIQVEITTTNVTFYSDQGSFLAVGIDGSIDYRIYYES